MNPARRVTNLLKFQLGRLLLRGPQYRLLIVALLIVLVATAAGGLLQLAAPGFDSTTDAIWWAFLRLTDPGYLGDDEGAARRTISTAVTIIGYVIFMGALIAIMTQWFHATMDRLGRGLTPIVAHNHVVLLGWSQRTPTLVKQLLLSEGRISRFLRRIGEKRLTVVILAEEAGPQIVQELVDRLGPRWNPKQIIVRSGSPLRLDHLRRVDFLNAAVIVMPGEGLAGEEGAAADSRAVKTLLSISTAAREAGAEELPLMVAELTDARNAPMAERAYGGPIEVISSDQLVARLLAQSVRHPGLSHVFNELLSHDSAGNELYLRDAPSVVGRRFTDLIDGFPGAVPVGLVRQRQDHLETLLCPAGQALVEAGDRVVVMAPSYQASLPSEEAGKRPPTDGLAEAAPLPRLPDRRILVLGWNHKVPTLVRELDAYEDESFVVDVVSLIPASDRDLALRRRDCVPQRVALCQVEGEYTSASELAALDPASYDAVLLVASDWLESEHESDARTVHGFLVLDEVLQSVEDRPQVLVELTDGENVGLFDAHSVEVVVSAVILSHVLTQVALRRELGTLYDDLFGPDGAELSFQPVPSYGLSGRGVGFTEVLRAAAARGHVALGLRFASEMSGSESGVVLNPPHTERFELGEHDDLVVLVD